MNSSAKILALPNVRAIFEGIIDPLFHDDTGSIRLIVYPTSLHPDSLENESTLGVLDLERNQYYEVTFLGDSVTDCRKYTADNFSHGTSLARFREEYLNLLSDRLPPAMKRRLLGLFLSGESGIDRQMGGFCLIRIDNEGRFSERCIEIQNRYL